MGAHGDESFEGGKGFYLYIPPATPLEYTLGIVKVPAVLLVTFVTTYCDDPIVNSYKTGVLVGKRAIRSVPDIVVVA